MVDVYFSVDEVNFLIALIDSQIELNRLFNNSDRFVDLQVLRMKVNKL